MYSLYSSRNQSAFTLIELLIVVAIIGILSAVAASNYHNAIDRADRAATQQNLRTLHSALHAYRVDQGVFPLADCLADSKPRPDKTVFGCGPAANGYWCGVPLILDKMGYCPRSAMVDPALRRAYSFSIEAYPSCNESSFAGRHVPQWTFLRYAYNSAAADTGGHDGGDSNVETDWRSDVWMLRSLNIDPGSFAPGREVQYPYRFQTFEDGVLETWRGEYEITAQGSLRERLTFEVKR